MSYDISIREVREVEVYEDNYTYNVSGMFRKALGGDGLNELHGKKCSECGDMLIKAIADMKDNKAEYLPMNPANGWGSYEGALSLLNNLLYACKESETGIISIS